MKLNSQSPEPIVGAGSTVVVHSIFQTIQGEGPFAGVPAVFVRLAGCNLQCPLCDTEYTSRRTPLSPAIILAYIVESIYPQPPLVVITGGEPLRQPIGPLCELLLRNGYTVQVETNGTLYRADMPYEHPNFYVVCSPKTHMVNRDLLPYIKAFKYVATAGSLDPVDGLPTQALEHPRKRNLFRAPKNHPAQIFLQPVDEQDEVKNAQNVHAVVRACIQHNHRLCLQIHKLTGLE